MIAKTFVVLMAAAAGAQVTGPAVVLSSPGRTLSGQVTILAIASAADAVQFNVDGKPLGAPISAPPYAVTWDTRRTSDGEHVLTAVAIDKAGASAASPRVHVTVKNQRRVPMA